MKFINFFLPVVLAAALNISSLIAQTPTDDNDSSQQSDSEETMILTSSDSGKSMELTPHQKLCIALPLDPTKGGNWIFTPSTPGILQLTECFYDEFFKRSHISGVKVWFFSPTSPGTTTLTFSYYESWNDQPQPPLNFTIIAP